MSLPYQFSRESSKQNAFCWMNGEPSLWNNPQQLARATIQAKRAAKLGADFYPQHTTNFDRLSVGKTVAADRRRREDARSFMEPK